MHTYHHVPNASEIKAAHPNPPVPYTLCLFSTTTSIVALDFIRPLPEEHGKDTILTMMDLLGANIHITATTAAQVAIILFDEWYCENSLILHLISDQDLLFTTKLWTAFHKLSMLN